MHDGLDCMRERVHELDESHQALYCVPIHILHVIGYDEVDVVVPWDDSA